MACVPPLLRRFPALERIPRRAFVQIPTPLEPLALAGVPEGALFVKRDDRSCALYGGNKPRKLEFVLGAALARGARRLVTAGALGTHHGLATTLLGREAGLATTVVLVPQPLTEHVRDQLRLMAAFGARLLYARGVPHAALQVARGWLDAARSGERPFWVAVGGSSPAGCIGFVSAALELAEQVGAGEAPEPREIYVPVGSGGTLAGLVLGARLAELRARIVGVVVTRLPGLSPPRLARLARRTLARLRRADPSLPAPTIAAGDFELTRAQIGPDYGVATPAAREAAEAAAAAGLRLETTYTAKCLAEVRARLARGATRGPVLFWHTFNGIDVAAQVPAAASATALPRAIRALLARGAGP